MGIGIERRKVIDERRIGIRRREKGRNFEEREDVDLERRIVILRREKRKRIRKREGFGLERKRRKVRKRKVQRREIGLEVVASRELSVRC